MKEEKTMNTIKSFNKSYILASTIYVVLGCVMLAWPAKSINVICYGLGFLMLALGITYGVICFTKENFSGAIQIDLVIGIVCLAFGIFILLNQAFLASVLPFAIGIILLLGAILKIQSAVQMRRLMINQWKLVLIIALVIIAASVILLWNPFATERQMVIYIGICLIFDGLTNLFSLISMQMRTKKLVKLQTQHPEADPSFLIKMIAREQDEKKARKSGVIDTDFRPFEGEPPMHHGPHGDGPHMPPHPGDGHPGPHDVDFLPDTVERRE